MVHRKEMLLPLRIDRLQHDHLHQVIHQRLSILDLFLAQQRLCPVNDPFANGLRPEFPTRPLQLRLQREMPGNRLIQSFEIPLFRMSFLVDILREHLFDHLFDHLVHIVPQRFTLEDLFSLFVNHLPLAVHDIVIFQEMLSDIEILPLDSLLSIFDRLRNQPMLDGLSLLHTDPVHDGGNPLRTEDP